MTTYPVEFHRRLEQKWASRIDQILSGIGNTTPPRDPNDDDDEDENCGPTPSGGSAGPCNTGALSGGTSSSASATGGSGCRGGYSCGGG